MEHATPHGAGKEKSKLGSAGNPRSWVGSAQIVLASGNAHKAEEFRSLAAGSGLSVVFSTAREYGGMPAVAEDTGTFVGNARKKAQALSESLVTLLNTSLNDPSPADLIDRPSYGHSVRASMVLADDSGLCVDALNGEPGVESAYYAGPTGDAAANRRKLLDKLQAVPEGRRGAHFYCLLLLIDWKGAEHVFEGRCDGRLLGEERGAGGFGYDALFVPEGFERTLAEMSPAEKNAVSHRARAWARLAEWLRA